MYRRPQQGVRARSRQAKVGYLGQTVTSDQHVGRLHILMDEAQVAVNK